jgi:hypothetical protein
VTTSQADFARDRGVFRESVLWVALAIALSPVLTDLCKHLVASPWARYALAFPLLTLRAFLRGPGRERASADGFVLLLLALGFELLAVGGGIPREGRLALPLAALGLARARGIPAFAVAALFTWWVPVPHALVTLGSPYLEASLVNASVGFWQKLGLVLHVEGVRAVGPHGALALDAADGGVPLLGLLSGIGWYAATLRGSRLQRLIATAGAWALLAFPIQAVAVLLAVGVTAWGAPDVARLGLNDFLWLTVAMLGWTVAETDATPREGSR